MFNDIFIADIFGFIISLPIALFLAFWMSAVKNRFAVIAGAFVGALIAFFVILAWAGTLIHPRPLPYVSGAAAFFGSALFCTIMGLITGMITDLVVARINNRDYRRNTVHE